MMRKYNIYGNVGTCGGCGLHFAVSSLKVCFPSFFHSIIPTTLVGYDCDI